MDLYMRAECGGFLQAAVLETVLRLLESKQSAELNPAKMDSPDDACSNAEFLLQVLDQVWTKFVHFHNKYLQVIGSGNCVVITLKFR